MTNLSAIAEQLRYETEWQEVPGEITSSDYLRFVLQGLETLFIHQGRSDEWGDDLFVEDHNKMYFTIDLSIAERHYVLLSAKIGFLKKVQSDVNVLTSYTTNAMSITGGDKPYAHLKDSISELENERRILYYKMTTYSLGV